MLLDEILKDREDQLLAKESHEGEEEQEEFEENELEDFIGQWEHDFDKLNPNPEENSDFDSDNDVNPLDSLNQLPSVKAQKISSENPWKKKPIQLSVIGRPNVGKSTFVNGLLKEERVIANDLEGTTRDSVFINWSY